MRPAEGLLPFQHNELEFSATPMSALGQKQTWQRHLINLALANQLGPSWLLHFKTAGPL